ncbi:glycosyltransferase [bacterium]|nr:glycosyltransferase [bacterium]
MTRLLSLVMIVRDEAAALPAFLAHHRSLGDEVVVVDTGSRDDTVALARAGGAVVLSRDWDDDFAAARNTGLAAARGARLLLLDADERIAAADFAAVRAAAAEPPCAWLVEVRNYCAERSRLEWRPVRGRYPEEEGAHAGYFASRRVGLFPRRDDVRFRGRIHESVLPDCAAAGLPLRELAVPVHHYGHVASPEVARRRRATYERLAALKLTEAPDDPAAQLEHATALLEAGRATEAESHLERLAAGDGALRPVTRGRFLLARLWREQAQAPVAESLLRAATRDDPGFLFAWLELARLQAAGERWRDVFATLAAARAACGVDEPLLGREEVVALARTGRLAEAQALAAGLAAEFPRWPELGALAAGLARLAAPPQPTPGLPRDRRPGAPEEAP